MSEKKYFIYMCPNCKEQLNEDDMGSQCPNCNNWQYDYLAKTEVEIKADVGKAEVEKEFGIKVVTR